MKKSKSKLSNATDEIKEYFDDEAKETPLSKNKILVDSDDSEDDSDSDDDDDDQEEEELEESKINETKSYVDNNNNETIQNFNVSRKRKCEFSSLDDNIPKKKDGLSLRWLPNGNKVSTNIYNILYSIH